MLGKIALALAALILAACAKPKYETVINSIGGGEKLEKVSDCRLKMPNTGYCALTVWEKAPAAKEAGILTLKIVRANALDDSPVLVELASPPAVILWMPEMGHGSVPTKVERVDQGSYRVSNVFFVMPGTWEIRIQIKNGNVVQDEAILDFTL